MDKLKESCISAIVFINEDTNVAIIHLDGFKDIQESKSFTNELLNKGGIEYQSYDDDFGLPTLH